MVDEGSNCMVEEGSSCMVEVDSESTFLTKGSRCKSHSGTRP